MISISFMSANYVARQLDFKMTEGWGQGDKATNDYFSPLQTFEERLKGLLWEIRILGFDHIDLWTAHLNWQWATEDHVRITKSLLEQYQFKVVSLAGGFGNTEEEFRKACKLAHDLGINILGGNTGLLSKDRQTVISILKEYNLRLGIENHPEKYPKELLDKIGDGGEGRIGACIDTGWFGTQGYNAMKAIDELKDYLVHIHLKDVLEEGSHKTCRLGNGIVPVMESVDLLKKLNYQGTISIEHEPADYDPSEDCQTSLQLVKEWVKP